MIKNKIKMVLQYKNAKQSEFIETLNMSSKQALNNKFANDRFTVQDIIKICDQLDCTLEISDKKSGEKIVTFDKNDLKQESTEGKINEK